MSKKHSFYHHNEKPWPNERLKNGVIIGHTTTTTARIWLRTRKTGNYLLALIPIDYQGKKMSKLEGELNELLSQKEFQLDQVKNLLKKILAVKEEDDISHLYKEVKTEANKDFTATLDFTCLSSGQRYRYFLAEIRENDQLGVVLDALPYGAARNSEKSVDMSTAFYFQTLKENPDSFSFALFSCHNPYVESKDENKIVGVDGMNAWDSLVKNLHRHRSPLAKGAGDDLAFVIAGGDQCYVDGKDGINIWKYLYKVMEVKDGVLYPDREDMISWYRNIYRAYWGFAQVRSVFGMYPTYMIWDDHEIGDGWGSYEPGENDHPIYDEAKEKNIGREHAKQLLDRMFDAAKQVYIEYEHSHNPTSQENRLYYDFSYQNARFYVLDGRGHRDIARKDHKILGKEQLDHFRQYVSKIGEGEVLFVVSAVPVLHTRSMVVNHGSRWLPALEFADSIDIVEDIVGLNDDLKDSWEHPYHDQERENLMRCLWEATDRGVRVCILSGDVHASALFEMSKGDKRIYQITSSAITYHIGSIQKILLREIVTEDGETDFGARYERLAYFNKSSYAMVRVKEDASVEVRFYDATQSIEGKDGSDRHILTSLGTHKLWA